MKRAQAYICEIFPAWKSAMSDYKFALKLLLVPGLFFVYSALTQNLGEYVEARKGILLHDVLLEWFPSFDFSVWVFLCLYGSLSLVVLTHLNDPKTIWRIIEMHFLIAVVRQVCILLIALEPPTGLIVLRDVFLENTVYPRQSPLTKDLFFSGHVASVYLYYLVAKVRWVKKNMVISVIAMVFMILSMRVHYTYDVYGAFLFTFLLYKAPVWWRNYRNVPKVAPSVSTDRIQPN
ncbi:MAG TPA: hypothetical protein DCF44_00330 [Chitinophagaceae bacterium]|nr:hypothetical protein [Chitinophagaceae bacterium]